MYSPFLAGRNISPNGSLRVTASDFSFEFFVPMMIALTFVVPRILEKMDFAQPLPLAVQILLIAITGAGVFFSPWRTFIFDVERRELQVLERKWFREETLAWTVPFSSIERVWLAGRGPKAETKTEPITLMISTRDGDYLLFSGAPQTWLTNGIVTDIEKALKARSYPVGALLA